MWNPGNLMCNANPNRGTGCLRSRLRWLAAVRPYLYILPSFMFLFVFTYYPIVRSLLLSLYEWNLSSQMRVFVGMDNYRRLLFDDPLFWQVMRNNALYAIGTIPTSVALGLLLAVLMDRQIAGRSVYRVAFFYPTMLPMAAASMIWLWIFTPGYGLLNYYLGKVGFPDIEWVGSAKYALLALIIVAIWKYAGYYMVLLLAGLQGIPHDLYEAARIEGASSWQEFWYITFPMLSPTTFFVLVMAVINSFQSIDQVYLMTRGGPGNATNMLAYYIYQTAFRFWDVGYASTLTSVLFVILLVTTAAFFRFLGRRIHYT